MMVDIVITLIEADLRAAIDAGLRAWGRAGGVCVTAKMRGEIADQIINEVRRLF